MSDENLKDHQETVRTMLAMGCDREMAAKAVGWTVKRLRQVLKSDPEFEQVLLRAEGQAEFLRMKLLHVASKDEKNWRAATWWLERRAQKRYSRRTAKGLTTAEIQELIDELVEIVFREVTREDDRERLVTSLAALAITLEQEAGGVLPKSVLALAEPEPKDIAGSESKEDAQ